MLNIEHEEEKLSAKPDAFDNFFLIWCLWVFVFTRLFFSQAGAVGKRNMYEQWNKYKIL